MPRKTDYDWTKERLDRLIALGARGIEADGGPTYEEGPWTVLKLMAVEGGLNTYLRIMEGQREKGWAKRLHFIDFNAGAGVVALEETNAKVAGTALLGFRADEFFRGQGKGGFDKLHFVEPDPDRAGVLRRRLVNLMPAERFLVYEDDADVVSSRLLDELGPKDHYIALVDPYGFQQGTWQGYGRLMEETSRGDFLINLQTTSVKRTSEAARASFFGPHYPGDYASRSEDDILASFRRDCLGPHRPRTEAVRVKAGGDWGRYYYDVVYAVAETVGGSPFVRAMTDLQQRVARIDGGKVKAMLTSRDLFSF